MVRRRRPRGSAAHPAPARAVCWGVVLALSAVLVASGCVQRRMTIRSNPPGALVYVDNYEIGTTPVSTNFTYYGTRKIQLVRDGYETLTEHRTIPPPWYQIPPLDFFTENLIPGTLRDRRTLNYQLVPKAVVPTEQLPGRGEELRSQTLATVSAVGAPPEGIPMAPYPGVPQMPAPALDQPLAPPDQENLAPPLQPVPPATPTPPAPETPPWRQPPPAQPSWQPPAGSPPRTAPPAPSARDDSGADPASPSWWPSPDGRAPMTPIP